MAAWPIAYADVLKARDRIRPHLPKTALRAYAPLDAEVGRGVRVLVKHENHNPTNSFKARNGLSFMAAQTDEARRRGILAAPRGHHRPRTARTSRRWSSASAAGRRRSAPSPSRASCAPT